MLSSIFDYLGFVDGLGCPFDMAILLGVSPKCGENFQVLKSFMNRFAALIHQRSNHNRLSIILYSDRVIKMTNINESLQTSMKQVSIYYSKYNFVIVTTLSIMWLTDFCLTHLPSLKFAKFNAHS